MKKTTLSLLILISFISKFTFGASAEAPIGMEKLISALKSTYPRTNVLGKEFILEIPQSERNANSEFQLTVNGKDDKTFSIEKIADYRFLVTINEYSHLYNFNLPFEDFTAEIMYVYIAKGSVDPDNGEVTSDCALTVNFWINKESKMKYTPEILEQYKALGYSYSLNYDKNKAIRDTLIKDNFVFNRKTNAANDKIEVQLIVKAPNQTVVFNKITTLDKCGGDGGSNDSPRCQTQFVKMNWSSCSKACGGGTQERVEICTALTLDNKRCEPKNNQESICQIGQTRISETRSCNTHSCTPISRDLTNEQSKHMKFNGVSVNIIKKETSLLSKKFIAHYKVFLTNPFNKDMKCDIELMSTTGKDRKWRSIDHKVHPSVFVEANSTTKEMGQINCKKGNGDNGLDWIYAKGHEVKATNCRFVQ